MSQRLNEEALLERWHQRIGQRRAYGRRRPFAAMGCLVPTGSGANDLLDLRTVLLLVLFDEPIGRRRPALRLVGYWASQVAHGVRWGGVDNCEVYKDLRLEPVYGAHGLEVDTSVPEVLNLALQLQSDLFRVEKFQPKAAYREPRLPKLWAGFAPADAEGITGEGPEFEALCKKFDLAPEAMLGKFMREHGGFCCLPIEWVSSQLHRSLGMFIDLSEMPRRQVFRLPSIPAGLHGFQGAAEFDFYNSKQRQRYEKRLRQRQEVCVTEPECVLVEPDTFSNMEAAVSP